MGRRVLWWRLQPWAGPVGRRCAHAYYSTKYAFAALKADGSVVAWGSSTNGGDCSKVQGQVVADVQSIYNAECAFAALKADGSVVAWGSERQLEKARQTAAASFHKR